MSTNNTPAPGSNSQPVQQALKDACYQFGSLEGDGMTARSKFCELITARSRSGDCTVDDASELWSDYQKGVYDKTKGTPDEKKITGEELAQRAADLKHYITLGSNQHMDGPAVLANATMLLTIMRLNGTAKGAKTWDTMLVFLRKQNKSNERELSDNEIEELFRAEAAKGADELARLTSVLNILNKQLSVYEDERALQDEIREKAEAAGEDTEDYEQPEGIAGVYTARDLIEGRIADLGGTRKEQRKAERTRIREQKKAAKEAAKNQAASP